MYKINRLTVSLSEWVMGSCKVVLTTTTTNFIYKHIILQKHGLQLARLFEAGQWAQNMKLRLRLTKESLQFAK